MNLIKKTIYTITCIVILLECIFAEALIENIIAFVIVTIINLNFIYVLWKLKDMED